MITCNIDVEHGLVNGSCGVLKNITFNSSGVVEKVWLDFGQSNKVGRNARVADSHGLLYDQCAPIVRKAHSIVDNKEGAYQVIRKQFPLTTAEALTIHKSQGQSYDSLSIDLTMSTRISRPMLYVALSRFTSLQGLYILGRFKAPKLPKEDDPVISEISRMKLNCSLQLSIQFPVEAYRGPDENPRYSKVISNCIAHFKDYDLDGLFVFSNQVITIFGVVGV